MGAVGALFSWSRREALERLPWVETVGEQEGGKSCFGQKEEQWYGLRARESLAHAEDRR